MERFSTELIANNPIFRFVFYTNFKNNEISFYNIKEEGVLNINKFVNWGFTFLAAL